MDALMVENSLLELTEEATYRFYNDQKSYSNAILSFNTELQMYRSEDDSLLNLLYNTQTFEMKELLKSNPLFSAFETLPQTCITRSQAYLDIMADQFSVQKSVIGIFEMSRFLNLTQGTDEIAAAWINRFTRHYNRIEPIFSSETSVVVVVESSIKMIFCAVFIKGIDKGRHSNRSALEDHLKKYPGTIDCLNHFDELRANLLRYADIEEYLIKL